MINPIEGPRGWIAGAFIGVGFGFLYARGVPPALAFVINKYRKRKAEPDPVRPRFGTLRRRDGDEIPLVFYPTENPDAFRGFHAGTEEIVVARPGDELSVDVLGPSQSVELAIDPSG